MISALDAHETVKSLTAAGFTDARAEALASVVKQGVDIATRKRAPALERVKTSPDYQSAPLRRLRASRGRNTIRIDGEIHATAYSQPIRKGCEVFVPNSKGDENLDTLKRS